MPRRRRPVPSTRSSSSSPRRGDVPSSSRSTKTFGAWRCSSSVSALSAARHRVLLGLILEGARQDVERQHFGERDQQKDSARSGKDGQGGNRLGNVDELSAHLAALFGSELLAASRPGEQDRQLAGLSHLLNQPIKVLLHRPLYGFYELFAHRPRTRGDLVDVDDRLVPGEKLDHLDF